MSSETKNVVIECGAGFTHALFPELATLGGELHIAGHKFLQNMSVYHQRTCFGTSDEYSSIRNRLNDFIEEYDPFLSCSTQQISRKVIDAYDPEDEDDEDLSDYLLLLTIGTQFLHNTLSNKLMRSDSLARRFLRFLNSLQENPSTNLDALITSNYDQVLDILLFTEINDTPCENHQNEWRKCQKRYDYGGALSEIQCLEINEENGEEKQQEINTTEFSSCSNTLDTIPLFKLNGSVNWLTTQGNSENTFLPLGQNVLFNALRNDYRNMFIPPLEEPIDDETLFLGNEIDRDDLRGEASECIEKAETVLFIGHSLQDGADQEWLTDLTDLWEEKEISFVFVIHDQDGREEEFIRSRFREQENGQSLCIYSDGLEQFINLYEEQNLLRHLGL